MSRWTTTLAAAALAASAACQHRLLRRHRRPPDDRPRLRSDRISGGSMRVIRPPTSAYGTSWSRPCAAGSGPISGTIEYDGKDVRSVKADVRIDINGIDTQNEKRDGHLRSPDFFDAANHPILTFKSKRVEPGSGGAFKLVGDLTIRGTTKEVVLDVDAPSPIVKGMGGGLVTGTTATTRIKRLEYGLKYNSMVEAGPVVGDEVTITIDIEVGRPSAPGTAAL